MLSPELIAVQFLHIKCIRTIFTNKVIRNDICCSLQSFTAIALKTKSYDGRFVTAKCSSINDGATLNVRSIIPKLDALKILLEKKPFDVFLVQTVNFEQRSTHS